MLLPFLFQFPFKVVVVLLVVVLLVVVVVVAVVVVVLRMFVEMVGVVECIIVGVVGSSWCNWVHNDHCRGHVVVPHVRMGYNDNDGGHVVCHMLVWAIMMMMGGMLCAASWYGL